MYEPGNYVWCTDHLDVGLVLRCEVVEDGELVGEVFMEVQLSCGLVVVSFGDDEPDPDYRPARRRSGVWESQEDGQWQPIDFSESELCPEPPTLEGDKGQDLGV